MWTTQAEQTDLLYQDGLMGMSSLIGEEGTSWDQRLDLTEAQAKLLELWSNVLARLAKSDEGTAGASSGLLHPRGNVRRDKAT